jgi:hypothetical protein
MIVFVFGKHLTHCFHHLILVLNINLADASLDLFHAPYSILSRPLIDLDAESVLCGKSRGGIDVYELCPKDGSVAESFMIAIGNLPFAGIV